MKANPGPLPSGSWDRHSPSPLSNSKKGIGSWSEISQPNSCASSAVAFLTFTRVAPTSDPHSFSRYFVKSLTHTPPLLSLSSHSQNNNNLLLLQKNSLWESVLLCLRIAHTLFPPSYIGRSRIEQI